MALLYTDIRMPPIFPDFAPPKLEDQSIYNRLVAEFPPHSDISFITLHIWWNLGEQLAISTLNNNLVINYHLPFDKENSGYSLIGKNAVDNSIETIFVYLRQEHRALKLVHVPDFVIEAIKNPEKLNIVEESDYNEYILASKATADLQGGSYASTRRRVNRFLRETQGKKIEVKILDLSSLGIKDQLFSYIQRWEKDHPWINDPERTEYRAIEKTLRHAIVFNIQNLAIYINEQLHAVIFYHRSLNKKYYVVHHLKVDYSLPYIVDYATQQLAKKAVEEDVLFINMEMDLGIEGLREHKMGLKPVHFFRKYTITPV